MSFRRSLMLVVALAALAPGTAAAQNVRVVARDVPLDAARSAAARPAPLAFTMIGIHWQGSGRVWFRTAARPGHYGPWRPAQPEAEDSPDIGSDELDRQGDWRIGNPWWTGPARLVQYRVSGQVSRLRAFFVDSPVTAADRARAASSRTRPFAAVARAAPVARPSIVRRAGWDADESIVRDTPAIAERLRFSVVHHTAGSNSYSAAESAAIVRGIQRYHVLGNGWDDIGYNFLVDKYGRVFEGRGGGIAQNVVGAHAGGFNTGSVGVAVIGNYESTAIPAAARRALQKLLAWRLDVGHVYPRGHWDAVSGGSSRWPIGAPVRLRAVSGHRDTSYTSCPGNRIYGLLGSIARQSDAHRTAEALEPGGRGRRRRARPLHRPALGGAPLDSRRQGCRGHGGRLGLGQRDGDRLDLGRKRRAHRLLHVHHERRPEREAFDVAGPGPATTGNHPSESLTARGDSQRRPERRAHHRPLQTQSPRGARG